MKVRRKFKLKEEANMLHTYEAEIYVNNIRTKESVSANDTTSAKKLIEARYPGSTIRWARFPRRVD